MLPNEYNKPISTSVRDGFTIFYDSKHPLAEKNGVVSYARHLCSVRLGRWLTPFELVFYRDGNHLNHDLSNLELVSRNEIILRNRAFNIGDRRIEIVCMRPGCGNVRREVISHTGRSGNHYCSPECASLAQRKFDPSKEALETLVMEYTKVEIGLMYGVSDKAVAKRCKKLGIVTPGRGYWQKLYAGKLDDPSEDEPQEVYAW